MTSTRVRIIGILVAVASGAALAQTCPTGNPMVAPTSRYSDNNDGTVTDRETGLMWKKCSEGQVGATCSGAASSVNWTDALNNASNTVFAGHGDWRVPSQRELRSLVEFGCTLPAINTAVFPNTPTGVYYFSSTTFASGMQFAWGTDFGEGQEQNVGKASLNRVRLVRGE